MGNILTITLNNRSYTQNYNTSISQTLSDWVIAHEQELREWKFYVTNVNNILLFDVKDPAHKHAIPVNLGKSFIPGQKSYKIIPKFNRNNGALIASNEVMIGLTSSSYGTVSLEGAGFATAM